MWQKFFPKMLSATAHTADDLVSLVSSDFRHSPASHVAKGFSEYAPEYRSIYIYIPKIALYALSEIEHKNITGLTCANGAEIRKHIGTTTHNTTMHPSLLSFQKLLTGRNQQLFCAIKFAQRITPYA